MRFDPDDDGLSDELAEEIRLELELGPQDESRGMAAVRAGGDEHLELVLSDEDGESRTSWSCSRAARRACWRRRSSRWPTASRRVPEGSRRARQARQPTDN